MSKYRHEYKYIINSQQACILNIRASGLLFPDSHAGEGGYYDIHSLYFDDIHNTCYYENEDGTDPRAKFRIRYYNQDSDRLRLEKKSKCKGMTRKESCMITPETCRELMQGRYPAIKDGMSEMEKSLLTQMQLHCLQPKVIVSYRRRPYIYKAGNVRVTFDSNISSSNSIGAFLEGDRPERQILSVGESILEVKWDEFLPSYIKKYLQLDSLQWSSFSKYFLCRKYNSYGGIK